jgi:hypothetical protein
VRKLMDLERCYLLRKGKVTTEKGELGKVTNVRESELFMTNRFPTRDSFPIVAGDMFSEYQSQGATVGMLNGRTNYRAM